MFFITTDCSNLMTPVMQENNNIAITHSKIFDTLDELKTFLGKCFYYKQAEIKIKEEAIDEKTTDSVPFLNIDDPKKQPADPWFLFFDDDEKEAIVDNINIDWDNWILESNESESKIDADEDIETKRLKKIEIEEILTLLNSSEKCVVGNKNILMNIDCCSIYIFKSYNLNDKGEILISIKEYYEIFVGSDYFTFDEYFQRVVENTLRRESD